MKTGNKGFSLVEILVVIAIMGVVAGGVTYSLNIVSNAREKEAASDFSGMISACQIAALSGEGDGKSTPKLVLNYDSNTREYIAKLYTKDENIANSTEVIADNISEIKYDLENSSENYVSSDDITLVFDKSTGALSESSDQVQTIYFGDSYKIILEPKTGYHEIK